jgi:hypothetical protein
VVEVAAAGVVVVTGLIIRAIFGAVIVVTLAFLLWKLGRLADAYTEKLKAK